MSISVYVKLDWAVEVQVRNEFFRGVTELLGSLTKNPMLMPMPPRGGAEIFPQGRCIMMHCRCCGWWGCCPYHNCCSPHIWQRINFKKPEVNIKKNRRLTGFYVRYHSPVMRWFAYRITTLFEAKVWNSIFWKFLQFVRTIVIIVIPSEHLVLRRYEFFDSLANSNDWPSIQVLKLLLYDFVLEVVVVHVENPWDPVLSSRFISPLEKRFLGRIVSACA